MDNHARDIVETPLDKLKQHPRNPNRGDVEAIRKSIRRNRWFGALVAQRSTGYVLAGNHRLMAARAEGLATVPVHWVDVSDEDAVRILLADNKTAEDATRDPEALAALLDELTQTSDLEGTGYDAGDLDALLASLTPKGLNDEGAQEICEEEFSGFAHTCPRCGFQYDE